MDEDLNKLLHPDEYVEEVSETEEKPAEEEKKKFDLKVFLSDKKNLAAVILVVVLLVAVVAYLIISNLPKERKTNTVENGSSEQAERVSQKYYDELTGEVAAYSGVQYNIDGTEKTNEDGETIVLTERQAQETAARINTKRISCIQIPNGTDARPQVGLSEAKIVYEAIAEGGITRFAAIYRGETSDVIGPVRSLRTYFLEWDLPYDCTIIHAGGEPNALMQVKKYPHLTESAKYMWRDHSSYYAPNNLFTSAELLSSYNDSVNKTSSTPKVFPRLKPDESKKMLKDIRADETAETQKYLHASQIYVHHTNGSANYNVNYTYDKNTNTYLRASAGNAGVQMTYTCKNQKNKNAKINPQKDCGTPTQVAPKVVIAMKVNEELNKDNLYREDIKTTGDGEAWVFQNGQVIYGTWSRETPEDQIEFKDTEGKTIKLAPGQTWIHAIAKSYGFVKF